MFGISSFEFLVILLVALVALGPEKMPGLIRRVTRLAAEFRRLKTDFHRTMNVELANLELSEQHKNAAPGKIAPEPGAPGEEERPEPDGEAPADASQVPNNGEDAPPAVERTGPPREKADE